MKQVLIVDDEHDILLALQLLLEGEGYGVLKASNGKEALLILEQHLPALILTDNMMPLLTGVELIAALKKSPKFKTIPIVMMSSVRPYWLGGEGKWDVFLNKPFEVDRVLAVVQRLIGSAKSDGSSSVLV
jgi:CheY-like chemotaxis protein